MVIENIRGGINGDALSNDSTTRSGASLIVTLTITTTAYVFVLGGLRWYYHHRQKLPQTKNESESQHDDKSSTSIEQTEIRQLQQQRKEERTGRIRAEVRLRTTLKQLQQLQLQLLQYKSEIQRLKSNGVSSTDDESPVLKTRENCIISSGAYNCDIARTETDQNSNCKNNLKAPRTMFLSSIGTVITPYTKRMGTPRQGALVPASRGYIQLDHHVPADVATGLELFSHIWVLFEFHANTDLNGTTVDMVMDHNNKSKNNAISNKTKKSKIRPPRGNGIKVGQLATRSPHRPNPIGLSLVTVERWDTQLKRLYISGIDIVNGTPVYDIKPVVPWDVPGYIPIQDGTRNHLTSDDISTNILRVPDWVSSTEDVIDTVSFTVTAQEQLQQCIHHGQLAPLYTNENDGARGATTTIQQILTQDPRSSHKGLKSNARGTKVVTPTKIKSGDDDNVRFDGRNRDGGQFDSNIANMQASYSLVFCNVKVSFTVTENDGCRVVEVIPIEFGSNQYVDGVPIITEGLTMD